MNSTQTLARYAFSLQFRQIPTEVIERAKDCMLDTLAVSLYGSTKPWSRTVSDYVRASRAKGSATVIGTDWKAPAERAALANGTMAHAFELDNVRQPGAGVHPGATGFLPAFAMAEEVRANGKALLTAFVAGCEVMSRIGVAAGNSLERRGFHAPGLTGTFGAAIAAGRLLGLNEKKLVNALGIAGSYSGGLIEFSRCQEGAMIKRLHLGKAAEGGVTAAKLASRGFAGPESVLEGKFGFCQSFSDSPKLSYLVHRLGRVWESMNICIKRCACHINAHAPIEALQELRTELQFEPEEIRSIEIGGIEKLITHHANYRPTDLMMAQYSIPFCTALSVYFDPTDPASFDEKKLKDKKLLAMMRKVRLKVDHQIEEKGWDRAARVTVDLGKKGRHTKLVIHFKGTPVNPMSSDEVEDKAQKLTRGILTPRRLGRLVDSVANLEKLSDVSKIGELLRPA
ncbi:MAG TPA: MmgE/PrpD family protein [Candidatus Limnocylindrales bacterium]|nr:MmgE/PrpD family protein [Candidatus Limnocylindrales bacterium]